MSLIIKAAIRVTIVVIFVGQLIKAIDNISILFIYPFNQQTGYSPLLYIHIASFVVITVVLFLLWRKSDWVVKIIAGDLNENELTIKTSNRDLIKVAMYMIGLWLLVTSIPNLFGIFAYHVRITNESSGFVYSPEQQAVMIKNMVTSAISIMIGLWLVLGNKGISKAIDTIINIPISKRKEE